jgi:hypothetical protein
MKETKWYWGNRTRQNDWGMRKESETCNNWGKRARHVIIEEWGKRARHVIIEERERDM